MQIITLSKAKQAELQQPLEEEGKGFGARPFMHQRGLFKEESAIHEALDAATKLIRFQQRRIRSLENLALTDELTQLLNRRAFAKAFRRELLLSRRQKKAAGCLIMVDLDGFKSINDRFGHAAGDAYLKSIAKALLQAVRETDIVARLGGDEFAIILTDCEESAGRARAEAIAKSLHDKCLSWKMQSLPLKASFGLAVYKGDEILETVMADADEVLYREKAHRRQV